MIAEPRRGQLAVGPVSNRAHFARLERIYARAPISVWYGRSIAIDDGRATFTIPVKGDFLHAIAGVDGSVYFRALDDAAFFAVNPKVEDVFVVTASFNVYFLRPVAEGVLTAEGSVYHASSRLFVAESVLRGADGKILAQGIPPPGADEVVVRVDAAPIDPSDLGLLFGAADMTTAKGSGTAEMPVVTATVPEKAMRAMAARVDQSMPAGNEGAAVVVAAGSSPAAQALLGKTVAALGGAMYSQHRCVKVDQCLPLKEGTTAAEGASSFVNPLTALGMVETMRLEGTRRSFTRRPLRTWGRCFNACACTTTCRS
jgi:uncharacterized protein (TIGR00369 family)